MLMLSGVVAKLITLKYIHVAAVLFSESYHLTARP